MAAENDTLPLFWPLRRAPYFASRRAAVISRRVGEIAGLFALLTLAWIPIDALVFESPHWQRLALVRVLAGGALGLLAWSSRRHASSPARALLRLAALYAVPLAFFVATLEVLLPIPREGVGGGVAAAYSFMPYMLAAGIAAFPLGASESLALAAIAFAAEAWALGAFARPLLPHSPVEGFWLVGAIASVAAYAAMSQLHLLHAVVRQSLRDPLTQCMRREFGTELLETQFLLATRHGTPLAVLFADIDRFKAVNDTFGHEAGDRVLAQAAASLRAVLRESDLLVRWGGEEFLVMLPHAGAADARLLVERLRARGFGRLDDGRAVTMSLGIAQHPGDGCASAADLVALADKRMYTAKQAGRNRCVGAEGEPAELVLALQ